MVLLIRNLCQVFAAGIFAPDSAGLRKLKKCVLINREQPVCPGSFHAV